LSGKFLSGWRDNAYCDGRSIVKERKFIRVNFTPPDLILHSSVRHLLRTETAADHAKVDAYFSPLIAAGDEGYCEFLRLSASALCPLERALAEADVETFLPDWRERSRTSALFADLSDLGVLTPPYNDTPALRGEAYIFGVVYVLEGSRLGADVLARRLLASEEERTNPLPLRYLRHGAGKPLWRTFIDRLEASIEVRRRPADAISGARATFNYFVTAGQTTQHCLSP
jgi:heme oxygenase (biliverdin-IX-beta and delta-forming)